MLNRSDGNIRSGGDNSADSDVPLERLLSGLPSPVGRVFAWVRRPKARWVRVPASAALIVGGLIGFLPILGFWMIPLGAVLLAEDIPLLRRPTMRALGAVQGWWDRRRGTTRGRP